MLSIVHMLMQKWQHVFITQNEKILGVEDFVQYFGRASNHRWLNRRGWGGAAAPPAPPGCPLMPFLNLLLYWSEKVESVPRTIRVKPI